LAGGSQPAFASLSFGRQGAALAGGIAGVVRTREALHSQGAVQSDTSRGRGVGSSISSMLLSGVVSARRDHNRDLRPAIHL